MSNAFLNASSLTGGISGWNVASVTNMRSMFQGATAFNDDLSGWTVSSVTSMRSMFQGAESFNGDLATWNVGNVETMRSMFHNATAFDGDLGGWNVAKVSDMTDMFAGGSDVGLGIDHYDSLLQGWAALPSVQPGVDFNAGNSYYNPTVSQSALGQVGERGRLDHHLRPFRQPRRGRPQPAERPPARYRVPKMVVP